MSRTVRRLGALLGALGVLLTGMLVVTASPALAASPPAEPAMGELGGPGPCTKGPVEQGYGTQMGYVWVHTPAGPASPRTGGTCGDAARPVVFIAPGYGGVTPSSYRDLIDNMVSNGHIVVYANYTLLFAPQLVYPQVLDGFQVAATTFDARLGHRMDLDNIGIWGHSYGAGMVPWLAKKVDELGWGSDSLWLTSAATSWVFDVPAADDTPVVPLQGRIDIPDHARVHVVAYERDEWVDHRVGFDIFHAYDIPDDQKDHIQILSDRSYEAGHKLPGSIGATPDHLDWYGTHKQYQVLSDCARSGLHCDADLTDMGTWSDGYEAVPAIVSDRPVDMGPSPANVECGEAVGSTSESRCGPGNVPPPTGEPPATPEGYVISVSPGGQAFYRPNTSTPYTLFTAAQWQAQLNGNPTTGAACLGDGGPSGTSRNQSPRSSVEVTGPGGEVVFFATSPYRNPTNDELMPATPGPYAHTGGAWEVGVDLDGHPAGTYTVTVRSIDRYRSGTLVISCATSQERIEVSQIVHQP